MNTSERKCRVGPLAPGLVRAMILLLTALSFSLSMPAQAGMPTRTDAPERILEVYVRDSCPHCADAKRFLETLRLERPDLRIELRAVDTDPVARAALSAVAKSSGRWPPAVPTFVYGQQVMVGFDDADTSGTALRAMLAEVGHGAVEAASAKTHREDVESPLFGTLSASRLGLPLFTFALGLLDGFNPCAMWVLLFLLSLLLRMHDRRRMALIAGTFVFVSALVYYAFMAAWLNVFLAVGMTGAVRIGLGLLALAIGTLNMKDFVAFGRGFSLSIPARARPGVVARMHRLRDTHSMPALLAGVTVLALMVNVVELLCTAGLPAVFTAVLAQQNLSAVAHHAYLGLYIMGYATDDTLMVALAVSALGSGRLTERAGRRLKLMSGAVMLALGLVLLLRPAWLL